MEDVRRKKNLEATPTSTTEIYKHMQTSTNERS
jgi:hypothetical protein